MENITKHFDELLDLFSSEDFLGRRAVSNEAPFFICHYDASEQEDVDIVVPCLVNRLETQGIQALRIDLYRLVIEKMKESGDLEWTIENESKVNHADLLTDLRAQLNSKEVIAPEVARRIREGDYRLVLMTGIGACYPIFEAHELLTNLGAVVSTVPLVLFFPGDYIQADGAGASLHLFGRKEGRGFYRAFDVETFIKMRTPPRAD